MKRRAVVFDDNALIRFTLWSFFDQRGYEVFAFPEPGLCPLHVVQRCPCPEDATCADLIISDVNMNAANGIDFIEQLVRKDCRQPRFALMSASFSEPELLRATRLGCKVFNKPLEIPQLIEWVEEVERTIPSERVLFTWA